MRLVVSPDAAAALRRMPRKTATRVMEGMEAISADPFGHHPKAKRLADDDRFRLRVGDWRALYRVDKKTDTVYLEDVLRRTEAYR